MGRMGSGPIMAISTSWLGVRDQVDVWMGWLPSGVAGIQQGSHAPDRYYNVRIAWQQSGHQGINSDWSLLGDIELTRFV